MVVGEQVLARIGPGKLREEDRVQRPTNKIRASFPQKRGRHHRCGGWGGEGGAQKYNSPLVPAQLAGLSAVTL